MTVQSGKQQLPSVYLCSSQSAPFSSFLESFSDSFFELTLHFGELLQVLFCFNWLMPQRFGMEEPNYLLLIICAQVMLKIIVADDIIFKYWAQKMMKQLCLNLQLSLIIVYNMCCWMNKKSPNFKINKISGKTIFSFSIQRKIFLNSPLHTQMFLLI